MKKQNFKIKFHNISKTIKILLKIPLTEKNLPKYLQTKLINLI